jgi:hypothetical protein
MALSLICACGARFEVEDTLAGQDVSCPECQQTLKAPALRGPSLRTSDLALTSTVLALVGAFTVIGTVAAVVVGGIALARIGRNRDRIAGRGFAVFGIAGGTLFTALTLLALSSNEFLGLGGKMRRNQLGDRVDTAGELTHEDAAAGFRIIRPSRDWGTSTVDKLDDPFVHLMQGPNRPQLNLLLVHTQRVIYTDVRSERRVVVDLDILMNEIIADLTPPPPDDDGFNPRRRRFEDDVNSNLFRITKVVPSGASKRLEAGKGIEAREKEVTVHFPGQKWKMLVRLYFDGDRLYVVRAYGQHSHFASREQEVRKLLDSFKVIDRK